MTERVLQFGVFQVDLERREVRRDREPLDLGSRALDILCELAAARGALVSKDELMAKVWPGVVVEENNLQVHISALRKALDSGRDEGSAIATVHGRGYRLLGYTEAMEAPAAESAAPPPLPDKPSIAVLPFQNMSGDPEQEYFGDGIAEDIITELSRSRGLFVIARNSSFTYKGRPVDIRQVGRELGVRYALEGSIRKAGARVRVTAQLVETETGGHVWVERYDRDLADLFAVQDDITQRVSAAIAPAIAHSEGERASRRPTASAHGGPTIAGCGTAANTSARNSRWPRPTSSAPSSSILGLRPHTRSGLGCSRSRERISATRRPCGPRWRHTPST
jgi:TolB-like protein